MNETNIFLIFIEHGIQPDGKMLTNSDKGPPHNIDESYLTFFSETKDKVIIQHLDHFFDNRSNNGSFRDLFQELLWWISNQLW